MDCGHPSQSGKCHGCFSADIQAENERLRKALEEISSLENTDRDDGYNVCAEIMRGIATEALSGGK